MTTSIFTSSAQFPADLLTFTEEILNGELHFLCSENLWAYEFHSQKKEQRERK